MNVKRFLAMILTLAMVMSMLPVGALAAEYTDSSAAAEATGVTATKTVSGPDENGQYTITLSVTGTSKDVTETQQLPADIVLVVDTSTSMDDTVSRTTCGGTLESKTGTRPIIGGEYTYYECTSCGATYVYNVPSACTEVTSRTNRLDVAKVAAKQFVSGLLENEGVQIGLYDFSGSNRTNVALTDNETTLNDAIDDMSMPSSGDGTDYTLGLTGAKNILNSSTKEQKFVVFISDGDPNGGNGRDVATQLKNAGVTIITVGVDIGNSTATALRNISSTNEDGDALYYAASSSGDSSTALAAILSQIQKLIEDTIHAGSNGVMVDIVNTDDFALVEGSASAELTAGENGTMTWNIGDITRDTKSVSFKVTPNEGSFGTLHTNDNVTLTFDSTVLKEQVTYSKDAIGDPTVYIAPPAITVTADSNEKTYDGTALTDNGYTVEGAPEGYIVTAVVEGSQTDAGSTTNTVTSVTVTNPAGEDVTSLFAEYIEKKNGTLTVNKRSVILTSEGATQEYNGKALTRPTVTVTGDDWAEGEGATVKATGSQITPGSCTNTIVCELNEGTNKNNYEITKNEGALTVTSREVKYEIDVVAKSNQVTYNGAEHTISGIEKLTFEVEGNTYTVEGLSASGFGTDAGTYTNEITGTAVVKDEAGNDVTEQFIVNQTNGTLTIDKRNVTLTSDTAEKKYDGEVLTAKNVTVSGEGWADGEGAEYDVTGSQKVVGSSANTFTYTLNEGTNADNYNITEVEGQLTVTDRDAKYEITVVANSDTQTYDGKEHAVSGIVSDTFTVDGNTYTVEGLSASAAGTDAGSYTANVEGTAIVRDEDGTDVTSQFAVTTQAGALTINKRTLVMTSASDEKEYDGEPLTNKTVTVTGEGFVDGEGAVYDVTGTRTLVGTAENSFTYTLNEGTKAGNYSISTAEGSLTVKSRTAKYEITVEANSGEEKYDGAEKTVSGFKTLTFEVEGNTYTVEGLTAEGKRTNAGETGVAISGTPVVKDAEGNVVTEQFAVSTVNGKLVITKRAVTLTSADDSKEYDGTPLTNDTVTVGGDGFANDEGATYTVTGSQTLKGESKNAFTYALNADTKAENYEITTEFGTLTIGDRTEKYEITVEANSDTKLYDGKAMTVEGFTEPLEYTFTTEEGKTATFTVENLTASVSGTDAGTYTNEITYIDETIGRPVVKDADGNDVTEQFIVKTVDGTLTINKRTVVMKSATVEKDYDGTPLENDFINDVEKGDGFINGEGATYTVTGSQLLVGSSENKFTYELNEGTKADNYNISTIFGTLTVTKRKAPYKILAVANSGGEMYNGAAQTVEGFETLTFTTEDGNTYTVSGLTASTTETDAGEYAVNVVGTPVVKDAAGNDVSDQFSVSTKNGTLTITKRSVTLTSATAQKTYDGKVLTNDTVTVSGDGFVEGEGASYNVTGSQLLVGSSDNYFTYTLSENTKDGNYEIKTVNGTLTVADRDEPFVITVEANSGEFDYDSTEKTVSGFKTLTFYVNENEYTVEGLTAEAAETNAGTYAVEVTGTAVVKDEGGNDVTAQFTVTEVDGELVINRATATVTVDENQRKVYGETEPELTATVTGLMGDDDASLISYTLTREAGENVGNYDITVSGDEVQGNYNVVYVNGTFRVTASALTLNNEDHMRYLQGYPNGGFKPEQNMTRAEVAVMFCRLLNNSMTIDTDAESPFSDVKKGDWYYNEVCFMAENGILQGYPDGTFGPWEPITRAEFATICTRFDVARQSEGTVLAEEFPDVTKKDWFYNYVMTAAGNGWVGGFPNGNFMPNDYITRSQVVTVVNRVLERVPDEEYIDNAIATNAKDFRIYNDVADNWAYYNIYEASVAHDYTKDDEGSETWKRHWLDLYTVSYHISGTDPDVASIFDESYNVGDKVELPTAEDVENLHNATFLGWSLTENAETPLDEYIVSEDDSYVSRNGVDHHIIHLYAVWG